MTRVEAFANERCAILAAAMRTTFILILFALSAPSFQPMPAQTQPPPSPSSSSSSSRQQPQPAAQGEEDKLMAAAATVAQATMNWDKSSSPGMKAEVQLIKKNEIEGQVAAEYHLKVNGASKSQMYTLMVWPVTVLAPVAMMDGLVVARDGTVGCPADSTQSCAQRFKGAELRLTYQAAKGEIYRHALISADKQSRIFFSIVPNPIVASDKGCSLDLVRLSPHFELIIVSGKGFQPGEELRFHTQSYQEVHDLPAKVDAQGEFKAQLTPAIKGRTAGTTQVVVTGKSCAPTLSFDWGPQQ